jgi:hypothetical protein
LYWLGEGDAPEYFSGSVGDQVRNKCLLKESVMQSMKNFELVKGPYALLRFSPLDLIVSSCNCIIVSFW